MKKHQIFSSWEKLSRSPFYGQFSVAERTFPVEIYSENSQIHNLEGPALVQQDRKMFVVCNQLHRIDGPADVIVFNKFCHILDADMDIRNNIFVPCSCIGKKNFSGEIFCEHVLVHFYIFGRIIRPSDYMHLFYNKDIVDITTNFIKLTIEGMKPFANIRTDIENFINGKAIQYLSDDREKEKIQNLLDAMTMML